MLRRGVKGKDPRSQRGAQATLLAGGASVRSTTSARLRVLSRRVLSIAPVGRRRRSGRDELSRMTKAELYDEARRLGVPGRSKMDSGQLAKAIRGAHERSWSSSFIERCLAGLALISRPLWAFRALSPTVAGRVVSGLRALPTRSLILSLVMLAAGGLGLTLAYYAVAPGEDLGAPELRANRTLRTETVTGPGGTTTFVVTANHGSGGGRPGEDASSREDGDPGRHAD